jgi:hypothetical protein
VARTHPPRGDSLAVLSVAFAIVWLFGLGSLLAIVLGYVARRRGTDSPTLALVGMWLGVLGVAIGVAFVARSAAPG